jgi:hypothetical protein
MNAALRLIRILPNMINPDVLHYRNPTKAFPGRSYCAFCVKLVFAMLEVGSDAVCSVVVKQLPGSIHRARGVAP